MKRYIIVLFVLLFACDKPPQHIEETTPDEVEAASDGDAVTRADLTGSWVLKRLGERDAMPGTTLEVKGDAITGSGGCNSYTSVYTWEGNTLKVSGVGSTEMACEGEMMTQERDYFEAITAVTSATLDEDTLMLEGEKGSLVFARAPQGGDMNYTLSSGAWTLDTIYDGEAASSPLDGSSAQITFAEGGKFSGNLGCNTATGTYELAPEGSFGGAVPPITITLDSVTERACAGEGGEAKMNQEGAVTTKLESATLYQIEGEHLTLVANGKPVLRFTLVNP